LLFKINADGDQAVREFGRTRDALGRFVKGSTDDVAGINKTFASGLPIIGGFSSALAPLAVGITAVSGGAVAAATAIFGLTKNVADAGSKFNDLSIKSGLSVETLSGLNLQLTQSGSSVEDLTQGVFFLQKNMAAAADGNDKLKNTFRLLNIDPQAGLQNTDESLRKVLAALAKIPDEATRNAVGAQVMGKGYQQLAVFVKDLNGDVDGAIEKAREMGAVWSGQAARDADAFGDQLDELSAQFTSLTNSVGREFLPTLTDAMLQLADILRENKDLINGTISAFTTLLSIGFNPAKGGARLLGYNTASSTSESQEMIDARARIVASQRAAEQQFFVDEEAAEKAKAAQEKYLKEQQKLREEHSRLVKEQLDREQMFANQTLAAVQESHRRSLELEAIYRKQRLNLMERGLRDELISNETAEKVQQGEDLRAHVQRIAVLEREIEVARRVYADNAEIDRLQHQLVIARAERDIFREQQQWRMVDAINADTEARRRNIQAILDQQTVLPDPSGLPDILSKKAPGVVVPDDPNNPDPVPDFTKHISVIGEFKDFATSAFSGIAQGFGGMIQSFLTGGQLSGKAFLQMAKAVAAGLAAQSLVEAAMQVAHAIKEHALAAASLAVFDVRGAALHEAAAAGHMAAATAFGVVGGVAAGIALAIPGGGGGAGAAAGSSGGMQNQDDYTNRRSPRDADPNDRTRREDRSTPREFIIRPPDGWVVEEVTRDYSGAGRTRALLRSDILGEPA
jgi:hypothetical protein